MTTTMKQTSCSHFEEKKLHFAQQRPRQVLWWVRKMLPSAGDADHKLYLFMAPSICYAHSCLTEELQDMLRRKQTWQHMDLMSETMSRLRVTECQQSYTVALNCPQERNATQLVTNWNEVHCAEYRLVTVGSPAGPDLLYTYFTALHIHSVNPWKASLLKVATYSGNIDATRDTNHFIMS